MSSRGGMKLISLVCTYTNIKDLSPLKGRPLKELFCAFQLERDGEIIRSLKTLETINGQPAAAFWKEVEALSKLPKMVTNSLGMKLALIPPGTFLMGSPENEPGRNPDEFQHEVTLTRPFYMGIHEVTVGQFRAFVKETGHKADPRSLEDPTFAQADDLPVVYVSWLDAVAFCEWLSKKEGKKYALPTEAQWEYSCRAGTTTRYFFEEKELNEHAWFGEKSGNKTQPVGQKKPNTWGLHDIAGNVYEWTGDWYGKGYYEKSPREDPAGPGTGINRVIRDGGFAPNLEFLRSANRYSIRGPSYRSQYIGFRVVILP